MAESTKFNHSGSVLKWWNSKRSEKKEDLSASDKKTAKVTNEKRGHLSYRLNQSSPHNQGRGSLQANELKKVFVPQSETSFFQRPISESAISTQKKSQDSTLTNDTVAPVKDSTNLKSKIVSSARNKKSASFTVLNVPLFFPKPEEFENIFSLHDFFSNQKFKMVFNARAPEFTLSSNKSHLHCLIEYLETNLNLRSDISIEEQVTILKNPLEKEQLTIESFVDKYQQKWNSRSILKPDFVISQVKRQKFDEEVEQMIVSYVQHQGLAIKKMKREEAISKCKQDLALKKIKLRVPSFDFLQSLASFNPILHDGIKNLTLKLGDKFVTTTQQDQIFTYDFTTTSDSFSITHERMFHISEIVVKETKKLPSQKTMEKMLPEELFSSFESNYVESKLCGSFKAIVVLKKQNREADENITRTITFEPANFHPAIDTKTKEFLEKAYVSIAKVPLELEQRLSKLKLVSFTNTQ